MTTLSPFRTPLNAYLPSCRNILLYGQFLIGAALILSIKLTYPDPQPIAKADRQPVNWNRLELQGKSLWQSGNYIEAEELSKQALAHLTADKQDKTQRYTWWLTLLALSYQGQNHFSQAEPLFIKAVSLEAAIVGRQHPNFTIFLLNLAQFYYDHHRYEKAKPLYLNALITLEAIYGKKHKLYQAALTNLGAIYKVQGRYAKGEPRYLEALEHTAALKPYSNLFGQTVNYDHHNKFPILGRHSIRYKVILGPLNQAQARYLSNNDASTNESIEVSLPDLDHDYRSQYALLLPLAAAGKFEITGTKITDQPNLSNLMILLGFLLVASELRINYFLIIKFTQRLNKKFNPFYASKKTRGNFWQVTLPKILLLLSVAVAVFHVFFRFDRRLINGYQFEYDRLTGTSRFLPPEVVGSPDEPIEISLPDLGHDARNAHKGTPIQQPRGAWTWHYVTSPSSQSQGKPK